MKAAHEYTVAIIRGGENFEKHGDDYDFVCNVAIDGERAKIKGAVNSKKDSKSLLLARCAVNDALWRMGIREVSWERNTGKELYFKVKPPKGSLE